MPGWDGGGLGSAVRYRAGTGMGWAANVARVEVGTRAGAEVGIGMGAGDRARGRPWGGLQSGGIWMFFLIFFLYKSKLLRWDSGEPGWAALRGLRGL